MGAQMNRTVRKVADYWINKFSKSSTLDKADLIQESYLMYRKCLDSYDDAKGRSKFHVYYGACLRNHFINLAFSEARQFSHLRDDEGEFTCDGRFSPVDSDHIQLVEYIECQWWSAEEKLVWEQLLEHSRSRLSGLALQVFDIMVEPPASFHKFAPTNNITRTALGKSLGVSRTIIKSLDHAIKRAALSSLEYKAADTIKMMRK